VKARAAHGGTPLGEGGKSTSKKEKWLRFRSVVFNWPAITVPRNVLRHAEGEGKNGRKERQRDRQGTSYHRQKLRRRRMLAIVVSERNVDKGRKSQPAAKGGKPFFISSDPHQDSAGVEGQRGGKRVLVKRVWGEYFKNNHSVDHVGGALHRKRLDHGPGGKKEGKEKALVCVRSNSSKVKLPDGRKKQGGAEGRMSEQKKLLRKPKR